MSSSPPEANVRVARLSWSTALEGRARQDPVQSPCFLRAGHKGCNCAVRLRLSKLTHATQLDLVYTTVYLEDLYNNVFGVGLELRVVERSIVWLVSWPGGKSC